MVEYKANFDAMFFFNIVIKWYIMDNSLNFIINNFIVV